MTWIQRGWIMLESLWRPARRCPDIQGPTGPIPVIASVEEKDIVLRQEATIRQRLEELLRNRGVA